MTGDNGAACAKVNGTARIHPSGHSALKPDKVGFLRSFIVRRLRGHVTLRRFRREGENRGLVETAAAIGRCVSLRFGGAEANYRDLLNRIVPFMLASLQDERSITSRPFRESRFHQNQHAGTPTPPVFRRS